MTNKINKNKDLNHSIGNVIITFHWFVLIGVIIASIVLWQMSKNLSFIILEICVTLGILFNIYLFSKERLRKQE